MCLTNLILTWENAHSKEKKINVISGFLNMNLYFGKTFNNYIFSNKMLIVANIPSSFEKQA